VSASLAVLASEASEHFIDIDVPLWAWLALLAFLAALLAVDLLVVHRHAHEIGTREALVESLVWISIGISFVFVVWGAFGGEAATEYISGYLIEKSLSVDNVFVWALIMSHFAVPYRYQHRVLFWGIYGALVMRAVFIFAGVALLNQFEFLLIVFGAFLIYAAVKLVIENDAPAHPADTKTMKVIRRFLPTSDELDGQKLFTRRGGHLLATPLFAVLILVEVTDVVFAVDSVPAVLAVTREQFLAFSSMAFAILGLRALYFLFADLSARFEYLQQGLAIILAFVGVKMLISEWYHVPTGISLAFIALVLLVSGALSLRDHRRSVRLPVGHQEEPPPFQER
jgi:tellurite resistance protein TerC